jgi:8-oxo-dGTP pyrophosphatase MutT (NUDIX family)
MSDVAEGRRSPGAQLVSWLLHRYFLATRGLTIGVRAVVRSDDGKFLLVRHNYTPGWHFPGGGVEKNETIEHALGKEIFQETGLQLKSRPVLHGAFFNSGISTRDHVLTYFCEVDGHVQLHYSSLEIAEVGYFSLDALPAGIDPGTLRRMREIAEGQELSVAW